MILELVITDTLKSLQNLNGIMEKIIFKVFNNERDVTSTRTYEGNLTTFVKSIVAPIQDVFRTTTKEYTTFNTKREDGDIQRQLPSKQTIYDPNDITKTTSKETNIHDTRTGHMANKSKVTIYDPNDIAKTTTK